MRKRREERKLHRQNELQAKKATKSGPLRLGAKKIESLDWNVPSSYIVFAVTSLHNCFKFIDLYTYFVQHLQMQTYHFSTT